jgi:hypothetical protein
LLHLKSMLHRDSGMTLANGNMEIVPKLKKTWNFFLWYGKYVKLPLVPFDIRFPTMLGMLACFWTGLAFSHSSQFWENALGQHSNNLRNTRKLILLNKADAGQVWHFHLKNQKQFSCWRIVNSAHTARDQLSVLRSRIIFMRLRLRVKILMRLRRIRLRLLPYCISRQNF